MGCTGQHSLFSPFYPCYILFTEYGVRSFPRFCQKFSWQFHRPVGPTTAAVQPGKKKIERGTS